MIQSLPCPSCHRTLVLAADASLKAVLRCRHCSHQFVLGEMIEANLGFWEVVDDPNAAELSAAPSLAREKADNESTETGDEADLELAESSEYVSPQSLMKKRSEKKDVDWSKFEPITHEQYERMRRKGKSPIWSLLSVMLGGLASVPIATLLIWHLLGKDPLQMGPIVGRYVPWIVPAKFQPYDSKFADEIQAPEAGQSGFRRFDAMMDGADEQRDLQGSDRAMVVTDSLSATVEPDAGAPSRTIPPFDRRTPSAFPMPQLSPSVRAVIVGDPDSNLESPSQTPATPATGDNIFKLINEAEQDLQAWKDRTDDRESQKKLAQQTYARLSAIASAINDIPPTSPLRRLVRNELQTISQMVESQHDIQLLLQAGSRFWLDSHRNEATISLALVIEVSEANENANRWTVVASPSTAIGRPAIAISAPSEIAATITPGKKLFLLGTVDRTDSLKQAGETSTTSTAVDSTGVVIATDSTSETATTVKETNADETKAEPTNAMETQQFNASYIFQLDVNDE